MYLTGNEPGVADLIKRAYPDYNGKKISLRVVSSETKFSVKSFWDDGNRNFYTFLPLNKEVSDKILTVADQHPVFDRQIPGADVATLPPEFACVVRHHSGSKQSITVIINEANAPKFLPEAPAELSHDEEIVLNYTSCLKSTYAGIKNYRFVEASRCTGITLEHWESAKQSLISKGLLNKAGAVTVKGKNVLPNYLLKK